MAWSSALANPQRSFGGQDLYPTLLDKAVILLFGLVQNHPFVDGNKRVGHGAAELFLRMNEKTIRATEDELETLILNVASSQMTQEALAEWLRDRIVDRPESATE